MPGQHKTSDTVFTVDVLKEEQNTRKVTENVFKKKKKKSTICA